MHTLTAIIESLENNYSAYIEGIDGVGFTSRAAGGGDIHAERGV